MSEGRSSPAALQEQRRPDRHHVNLLHDIILRAQEDPLVSQSPKDALLNAYSATFEERNLDVLQDSVCFATLLKVIDPNIPSGSLYEKFENVLKDEGIELAFDDDASQNGTVFSASESASPIKIDIPRRRPVNQPLRSRLPNPSISSWQSYAPVASQPALSDHGGEDEIDYDDYMDNPPPQVMEQMRIAEAMDRRTLIRQSLAVMRPRGVAAMILEADAMYASRLKDRVIHQWRTVNFDQRRDLALADRFYERRLKKACLRKVLDAARIQRIKAMDEERLKGMALYKMTLATREAQFRRKVDLRIKIKYLSMLLQHFQQIKLHQHELDVILQTQTTRANLRALRPAIEAMVQASRKNTVLEAVAQEYNSTKLRNTMVTRWFDKAQNIGQMQSNADMIRRKYLVRKYLRKLREAASAKRNRRLVLARWVLARWKNFQQARKLEAYDAGYRQMRKTVKMNLARGLLHKWADKARSIREMEARADQMYENKIKKTAHEAIVSMYQRSQQMLEFEKVAAENSNKLAMKHAMGAMTDHKDKIRQMEEVAGRFHALHSQQIAIKCLKQLSMKSFEIKRRERDAEAFRTRYDKKLVRVSWEKVRIVAAQRRGEGPLRLPPATPAQRRAEEINRLTSTTPLYTPAARSSFAARLRGMGSVRAADTSNMIVEESETSMVEDV